jgi:hypothetical protein
MLSLFFSTFAYAAKWLDLTVGANGSVEINNNTYTTGEHAFVDIEAIPDSGYEFDSWSSTSFVISDVTDPTISLNMNNSAQNLSATFVEDVTPVVNYTLTLSFSGTGTGSVSVTDNGTVSAAQTFTFEEGTTITLNATPDTGEDFAGWSGASDSTNTSVTLTMTSDMSITANFGEVTDAVIPGCGATTTTDYSSGFNPADFEFNNIDLNSDGYLQLQTGNDAIDPENIVIPFEQEVAVTFLYEGAGYTLTDFGWLLASEGSDGTRHQIYENVNDNNSNGVLDSVETDLNGDGLVNALDNRVSLGTFAAETELAFYLKVDNENEVFFTKTDWNPDTYSGGCNPNGGDPFTKVYHLGLALSSEGSCSVDSNWMTQTAIDRLDSIFDFNFAEDDTSTLVIDPGEKFSHVMVGTPGDRPNEWILGWEDLSGGGDTDHNDLIFHIERKTGGVAELRSENAISPIESNAYYTAVEMEVWDNMPCSGDSDIEYYLSIDDGVNWVQVNSWDSVTLFTLEDDGTFTEGTAVSDWSPGAPQYTKRMVRIDFSGQDLSGNKLIWKAVLTSEDEDCQPEIMDVNLTGNVATNGEVSRTSPVVQTNVLYTGSYETPALDWNDKSLRGHLRAMRIYDPTNPGQTDYVELWDAGAVLTESDPDNRTIYCSDLSISTASGESLGTGDGATVTFTGTLDHAPLLATTAKITDSRETFTDIYVNELRGSLGGTGTINRYTGEYSITFHSPPTNGAAIVANYSYHSSPGTLSTFTTDNISNSHLALDDTYIHGEGYRYDLDDDGDVDVADGDWLVNWVRGYDDGASTKKEWLLGPIDHSTPALLTAPGMPSWYYGTAITDEEREAYDTFRSNYESRQSVLIVGSRDGMLHAFDAGNFRWGDNNKTSAVEEKRGYFLWSDDSDHIDWWNNYISSLAETDPPYFGWDSGTFAPDYGTGEELWAFIPGNLIPRLKNNLLKGEDRAYVDASTALADVYIDTDDDSDNEWTSVALVAEGNGGDTVVCLDVTDPLDPSLMWEYAEPELFRSRSSPAVSVLGRILNLTNFSNETRWGAFFVSGRNYTSTTYPAVYILDIETGSILQKVVLDDPDSTADAGNQGAVPSGQPAIVDSDGNGYIDRAYIGTDKGYLYKIVIPDDPDSAGGELSVIHINTDFSYDSNDDGTEDTTLASDQRNHPIYGSPSVVVDNGLNADGTVDYNVRLFFGTGDSPYYDENINTANTTYQFFAYNDKGSPSSTNPADVNLEWYFDLPAGHRIFASAFASAGNIYFGSATGETEDPCEGPNEGRIFGFSYEGNPVITENDEAGKEVGDIYTAPLVEDEHLYIKTPEGLQSFGGDNYNNDVKMGGLPFTRMRYWREIF